MVWLCPDQLESLEVRGSYDAEHFDFVSIRILGCELGDQCMSEDEARNKNVNFRMLKAYPSILGDNKDETTLYAVDKSTYFVVEPRLEKVENFYFMESRINLEDNIWDILKLDEKEVYFFEMHEHQQILKF